MLQQKTSLKILITPNLPAPYDRRMTEGLARGFGMLGHHACALPTPISAAEVAKQCRKLSFDVVIQVNRTRHPGIDLPSNVRYISWFQDVFPETTKGFAENFRNSDILYALGDAGVLGLDTALPCQVGSLVSGVDPSVIDYRQAAARDTIDFSLCGFIPPPPLVITRNLRKDIQELIKLDPRLGLLRALAIVRRMLIGYYFLPDIHNEALITMMNTVMADYRPLRGELDIHALTCAMHEATAVFREMPQPLLGKSMAKLKKVARHLVETYYSPWNLAHQSPVPGFHALSPYERSINYFAREYPRLLDRVVLIQEVLKVSKSLELFGPGWNMHPEFKPYAKGILDQQEGLLNVYLRSRINLANNTHGLGLHSRTLECMAVGGFILTHESPHDNKPGGMLTSFEPGMHYGVYTPDSLQEEASRWLRDSKKRQDTARKAANIIRQRHCWHHRAQQILDDLSQ